MKPSDSSIPYIYYNTHDGYWHLDYYHTAFGHSNTIHNTWQAAIKALTHLYKIGRVDRFG